MIKVGVIGATGYTGAELLRLLSGHPQVDLTVVASRTEHGKPISELLPHLRGFLDLRLSAPDDRTLFACNLVFFATPNATAMHQAPALLKAGVRVIDLSADFRLKDPVVWREWYGQPHACPELLGTAIYGLPELHRAAIREAQLVANPGCYPSAILLALLPLLKAQVADARHLVADAKSGVSGAGRKADLATQFCEAGETFKAYALGGHRHHPEMVQCLAQVAGSQVGLTFVPHLVPMVRGILATVYAPLLRTEVDVQALFADYYRGEPFVSVLPAGSQPDTRSVRGTNLCRLVVHRPRQGDMAVVVSAIDNLMKGAAGQAVQNMNIMFGFPEEQGLKALPLVP